MLSLAAPATAQTLRPKFHIPDASVLATALSDDGRTLYLGGNFTCVGPNTGQGVRLSQATGAVRASVIDALGREVMVVLDAEASGSVWLDVNAASLAPGVYAVRVQGAGFAETRRLTVVR